MSIYSQGNDLFFDVTKPETSSHKIIIFHAAPCPGEYGIDYSGIVYGWFNVLNCKIYIGSHEGPVDDGYTGSGKYFLRAYRNNSHHFVRIVVAYSNGDRVELYRLEEEFLCQIPKEQLGRRYYNLKKTAAGGCRELQMQMLAEGRHNSQDPEYIEYAKKVQQKRVAEGKHHWTGPVAGKISSERQIKQIKEGTHVMVQTLTCPHCGMSGKGPVMIKYHFDECKLIKPREIDEICITALSLLRKFLKDCGNCVAEVSRHLDLHYQTVNVILLRGCCSPRMATNIINKITNDTSEPIDRTIVLDYIYRLWREECNSNIRTLSLRLDMPYPTVTVILKNNSCSVPTARKISDRFLSNDQKKRSLR